MGTKISGLCGGRNAGSTEIIIEASPFNQEDCIRAKSAVKIQNSWKKMNVVKTYKIKRLLEIKKSLDEKSSNENEFVTLEYMQSKVNPKVIETEKTLPAFNQEPEIRQFQLCFEREPILLKDGAIYFGQWNPNGQKHGYGILVRNDGSKYEGFFFNDTLQGRGRYIEPQGNFYYEGKNIVIIRVLER
jgi:hypothetical protein